MRSLFLTIRHMRLQWVMKLFQLNGPDALVAYLLNLKVDYELPEMKFSEEE